MGKRRKRQAGRPRGTPSFHDERVLLSPPPGTSPGTLHVDPDALKTSLEVVSYGPDRLREERPGTVHELCDLLGQAPVVWINVAGLGDLATLRELGRLLDLHPLALEDVVRVHQRAKVEVFGEWTFMVGRMVDNLETRRSEQLSIFVKPGMLITFQETPGDCFDPVRERLRRGTGRLRSRAVDYLAYALIDALIDGYFPLLDCYGDRLEDLEERILAQPSDRLLEEIHELRRELIALRKVITPHREAIHHMIREEISPFTAETLVFLRDCHDHSVLLIELLESYREFEASLMDLYHSRLSQKSNDVMKVLTMIATIFIPLSFVVGLYGMNFNTDHPWNMPELNSPWGYPAVLVVMVLMVVGFVWFFKRRGWF